jgi:hypothetical protein
MSGRHLRNLSCEDVEELAPELGLGVLVGLERAEALAHADRCTSCRVLIEDMAELGDSLLELGPEVEPPPGYEARLFARHKSLAEPSARRGLWAVVAAAAAAVVVVIGVSVGLNVQGQSGFHVTRPSAVAALGGRALSVAALQQQGHEVGQVFIYQGRPSWVFMTVESNGPPRKLTCEVETKSGQVAVLGSFTVSNGYKSWGSTVRFDPGTLSGVRLVDAQDKVMARANL